MTVSATFGRDHLARRHGHTTSARRLAETMTREVELSILRATRKSGGITRRQLTNGSLVANITMRSILSWAPTALQAVGILALVLEAVFIAKVAQIPPSWYSALSIHYPYGKLVGVQAWGGKDAARLIMSWAPLLLTVLCTCLSALFVDRSLAMPKRLKNIRQRIESTLKQQLPPGRLWLPLFDGLTVLDVLLLVLLVAAHFKSFVPPLLRVHSMIKSMKSSGRVLDYAYWVLYVKEAGKQFGVLMFIDIFLLFLPMARGSVLEDLTGLSHEDMLRYHKFLGVVTYYMLLLHALVTYAYWLLAHRFWVEFWDWGTIRKINNLAGNLSFLCLFFFVINSREVVRRQAYQWFYRCHILGFLGFMIFACMHYSGSWRYFTPGLALWAVDLVQRAAQMLSPTSIVTAGVDAERDVTTLVLEHDRRAGQCPLSGDIHLLLPALSRWAWHPFTVARGTPAKGPGLPGVLVVHAKAEGPWTRRLLRLAARGGPRARTAFRGLRACMPQMMLPRQRSWEDDEAVLVVIGGIAVTGLMRDVRELVDKFNTRNDGNSLTNGRLPGEASPDVHTVPNNNTDQPALPRRVRMLWAARHASEFLTLDPVIAACAASDDNWMTAELHLTTVKPTGGRPASPVRFTASGRPVAIATGTETAGSGHSSSGDEELIAYPTFQEEIHGAQEDHPGPLVSDRSQQMYGTEEIVTERSAPLSFSNSAAITGQPVEELSGSGKNPSCCAWFTSPRPLSPANLGPIHVLLLHVLAFLGGFAGLLLGWSWMAEAQVAVKTNQLPSHHLTTLYWKVGALMISGFCIGSLGLPFLLLMLPPTLLRPRSKKGYTWPETAYQPLKEGGVSDEARQDDLKEQHDLCSHLETCSLHGNLVQVPVHHQVDGNGCLPILPRRPDILAALSELSRHHSSVSILVAGPEGIYRATCLAVEKVRSQSTGCRLTLHRLAGSY